MFSSTFYPSLINSHTHREDVLCLEWKPVGWCVEKDSEAASRGSRKELQEPCLVCVMIPERRSGVFWFSLYGFQGPWMAESFFLALLSALYSAVSRSETQYSCGWVLASSHPLFLWLLHFSPPLSYIHLFFSASLTVRTSLEKCIFRHSWSRMCFFLFPRAAVERCADWPGQGCLGKDGNGGFRPVCTLPFHIDSSASYFLSPFLSFLSIMHGFLFY